MLVQFSDSLGLSEQVFVQLDPGLPDRQTAVVRVGSNASSLLILNTAAPQGRFLSPFLLYSLHTHGCVAAHSSNPNIKFFRRLTKFGLSSEILRQFYGFTVESILTAWSGNRTALNWKAPAGDSLD